jgi:ketosteroid isomerase-like protein
MPLRSSLRIAALILAFFIPALLPAIAQEPDTLHTASRQELDVIKILLAQEAAWNRGDLPAFVSAYKNAPDTLFVTHQVSRGYAGLLDEYKHDYPTKAAMGTLGFSELEVRPLGETYAVALGHYRLDRNKKDGGTADGLFTLVLEKTDKGWKIIIDHTT